MILTNFYISTNPNVQCAPCKKRFKTSPERDVPFRDNKGCFKVQDINVAKIQSNDAYGISGVSYKKCPGNFARKDYFDLINMNSDWSKGVFAFDGPPSAQPAKYVEAMELVDRLVSHSRAANEKKLNKMNKALKRG